MKKSNKIIAILTLLMVPVSIGLFNWALINNNAEEIIDYEPIDIGSRLRTLELPIRGAKFQDSTLEQLKSASIGDNYEVGDIEDWLVLDDYTGEVFFSSFELKAIGGYTEIWLQEDLSYEDNRDTPIVTQAQIDYFLEEFETNINTTCVEYFGEPDFHDGSNPQLVADGNVTAGTYYEENGRHIILLSNIRDEMYYDDKYPYYIVGYYWGYFERMHDRNIVTIDVHDWENRIGDEAARPNLYEAVLAHEYQHLIHDDYNPYDDLFMNEGCSMYAEPLCGYPIDWGSINSFLFTPDNSLTEWGDQGGINILADYGQALLWAIYLCDHYGGAEFLSSFVQDGIPGIEGLNLALSPYGVDFTDVYHDWRIANLIHTDEIGEGKYNYNSIDLTCEDAIDARIYELKGATVPSKIGSEFGFTKTILNYNTKVKLLGSYGSDYIEFVNLTTTSCDGTATFNLNFYFDGDDKAVLPTWIREDQDGDGDLEWYSTSAKPESDLSLYSAVSIPDEDDITLSFDTYYDIEPLWDYGFVQTSTDNGLTWTSLNNEYTTFDHDPDAYPAIIDNLPGLTGTSDDWFNMEFNLTNFRGQDVILSFRYMTDWGTENPGWWIDNIKINEVLIDDADDTIILDVPEPPEIDFIVTLIHAIEVDDIYNYDFIETMVLDDITEIGILDITDYVAEDEYILLIISPTQGPADYQFGIIRT